MDNTEGIDGTLLLEESIGADTPPRLSELVAEVDGVESFEDTEENSEITDGTCMICGLGGSVKPLKGKYGVFSNSFTTDDKLGYGDGICHRCEHLANETDYRRYHWVASEEGVTVIKERPDLVDALLDPPEGPWMAQYKDGSDFLTILNGWIAGQQLNTSRDRFGVIVDKRLVHFERPLLREMIEFGQELRDRDDAISKRALMHGPTAADLSRYDISRDEYDRLVGRNDYKGEGYVGREDWRIAVQLIQ